MLQQNFAVGSAILSILIPFIESVKKIDSVFYQIWIAI